MKVLSAVQHIVFALGTIVLAGCTANVGEGHFFHPGAAERSGPIVAADAVVTAHTIRAADGVSLAAAYIVRTDADQVILYFGGNVSRIDDYGSELAKVVAPLHANLFLADYRGYGRSGGTPTLSALQDDALATYDYLRALAPAQRIIVHGFSMGSFLAAHVAVNRPVDALILEATAPDVTQWAKNGVPWYAKPFVRLRIAPALQHESNEDRLKQYRGPLLLVAGTRDPAAPPKFARSLFQQSASALKRIVVVDGAGHGNALMFPPGMAAYRAFLSEVRDRR